MFKKLILLLFIVAPITIFAQDKIAYINSNEIFSKMPELVEIQNQLKTESEAIQKKAASIEAEYNSLLEQFQKDTTVVSESIQKDRQSQLDALAQRFQTYVQTSSAELKNKEQALLEPIDQKVRKAIKEVGDENGYTYIIDATVLVHVGANATDAGPKVKAKLGITN